MRPTRRHILTAALLAALSVPAAARAQAVDFSGKQIEWVIPLSEGGGTDVWARFLAPYLSRYLPGQPAVFIRNVPGGGSITGTNQFAARPRTDGTALIGTTGSTALPMLLGDRRVSYDFDRDFTPLLVSPSGGVVYLPPSFGVTSIEDLTQLGGTELVYGSQGPTGLDIVPMLGFELLGLNVRHVFGMTGRGDGRLAFLRGEATIDYQTTSAYLANVVPMVEEGTAVPLFSWGVLNGEGRIVRDPTFPELPSFVEAYEAVHGAPPEGLPGIAAIAAPGHTPHHLAFVLDDGEARVILAADAVKNRAELMAASGVATRDGAASRATIARIGDLWRARPGAILVCGHDLPLRNDGGAGTYLGTRRAGILCWFGTAPDDTHTIALTPNGDHP